MLDIEHVRRSVLSDALYLAERLRPADLAEVEAGGVYDSPYEALYDGFMKSLDCWTITDPETKEPLAMFGVMPYSDPDLYSPVWLLGTERLEQYAIKFLRSSRKCLNTLAHQHGPIGNYVDMRNVLHIKWLERNGFAHYHTVASPCGETAFKLYIKE